MVGEAGAGKSSLLNTFTTALSNKEDIDDAQRIGPSTHGRKSATQEVHFNSFKVSKYKKKLTSLSDNRLLYLTCYNLYLMVQWDSVLYIAISYYMAWFNFVSRCN